MKSVKRFSLAVPPHIAWPAFVIILLLFGIGTAFAALWAAQSDGGAVYIRDATEETRG